MNISTRILHLLNNFEETLICTKCKQNITNAVRIRTCGHYFCEFCIIDNSTLKCPQCNEIYRNTDLCKDNVARSTEKLRSELRTLLESNEEHILTVSNDNVVIPATNILHFTNNLLNYNGKQYKINFIPVSRSKINAKGENLLHLACRKNDLKEIKRLIKYSNIDLNGKDYAGWTPLHEAVETGQLSIVKHLVESGCLIDVTGSEFITPLIQAVSLSNPDIVKFLLEYNADKEVVNYYGKTALDLASDENIKKLLQNQRPTKMNHIFNLYLPSEMCVYCHSIDKTCIDLLSECKTIHIEKDMDSGSRDKKKITHFLVKETHKLSFKILQAILQGCQFVNQNFVQRLIDGEYFINEDVFTSPLNHLNSTVKISAYNSLLKRPQLFQGMYFYIDGHSEPCTIYNLKVDKNYLKQLIEIGGGKILQRAPALRTCAKKLFHPFFAQQRNLNTFTCCHYIIYPENNPPELIYNMAELLHRSSIWLIDCIIKYQILD